MHLQISKSETIFQQEKKGAQALQPARTPFSDCLLRGVALSDKVTSYPVLRTMTDDQAVRQPA